MRERECEKRKLKNNNENRIGSRADRGVKRAGKDDQRFTERAREKERKIMSERERRRTLPPIVLTDVSHKDSLSRAMYYSVNVYVRVYVCVYACVCVSRAWVRARVHAIRWLVCGRVAGAENTYDETGDARLWYENRHTNEHLNAFPPRVVC